MPLFRILGPISVGAESTELPQFATRKTRALLVALLLHPGHWISENQLAIFIWHDPPGSADANLRTYTTTLRRALDSVAAHLSQRLETLRGEGHRIRVRADEVDCHRFLRLIDQGAHELRTGRPERAAATLGVGLQLWRGPVGADLADTPAFRDEAERLHRRRNVARADLYEARLRVGEASLIVNDLHDLTADEPLSERPVALLIDALHAIGEPAAALIAYHRFRRLLADEVGTSPSLELQARYLRILRSDHAGRVS